MIMNMFWKITGKFSRTEIGMGACMSGYKKAAWLILVLVLTYFSLVSLVFYRNYGIAKKNDAQIQIRTS